MPKEIKLRGKTITKKDVNKRAPVGTPKAAEPFYDLPDNDREVYEKTEELHVFLTQRGIPYFLVTETPETKTPITRFSFNHKHNEPQVTLRNAETIFTYIGRMVDQLSQGAISLIRKY